MILAKYIRLSSADEVMRFGDRDESCSVTHQRMLLDRYITDRPEFDGCTALEFSDDGRSGTNFDRPGIQALLDAAKRHQIDCVVVKDFSRFGRNNLEVCDYIERVFPFLGVRFISVNDGYDSKDCPYGAAGDLGNGIRNLINEMYSRDLSQKSKAAKRQYAQRGQCIHGYPIYGYIKPPGNRRAWVPDPEAAPIVRQIFQRFLGGLRISGIAQELNDQSVLSPYQRKCDLGYSKKAWKATAAWTDSAVSRMLRDERYTGKLIALKTTAAELGSGERKKQVPKEDWIVIPNAFEAIISQQTFDEAQKRLQNQARPRKSPETQEVRLFYRKLRCAGCGKCLNRQERAKGPYYFCACKAWYKTDLCRGLRIFEDKLNESVLASIRIQAGLARCVEQEFQRQNEAHRKKRDAAQIRRRHMQMRLERLTTQKKETYLQYNREELSWDAFTAKCGALTQEMKDIQKTLLHMDAADAPAQFGGISPCRAQIDELKALEQLQVLDREIVDQLIQGIKVYPENRIEISWNFREDYRKLLAGDDL